MCRARFDYLQVIMVCPREVSEVRGYLVIVSMQDRVRRFNFLLYNLHLLIGIRRCCLFGS
jgi:hypothetical protein